MSLCYIDNRTGIKRTQKLLISSIQEELLSNLELYPSLTALLFSKNISALEETSKKIEGIKKEAKLKGKEFEGVSHFLDLKHSLSEGENAEYLCPLYIEENYIQNYIKLNALEGKNPALLEQEVKAQILDSSLEKEMGTLLHKLVLVLFETNGDYNSSEFKLALAEIIKHLGDTKNEDGVLLENGRTLRDIVTQDNLSLKDEDIVEILTNNAIEIFNTLKSRYPEAKFYPECELFGDKDIKTSDIKYKGLKGIADLIVVKKDGTIDIVDFKVCTRYYDLWCSAKLYHTEYLLGVYRHLLSQNGIDGSKVGLFILPIYLNKYNAEDTLVEKLQSVLQMTASGSRYSRLDWFYGHFTSNINYLIPSKTEMPLLEAVLINSEAMSKFGEMVDYNPSEKNYSKSDIIDFKLHDMVLDGKKIYYFYDLYERKRISNTDKEFFTKDGGYIDKYILKMKNVRNEWVKDLFNSISEYKSGDINLDEYNFLRTKGRGLIETILNTIFGEFCKWYYEPIDIPILAENGILGFHNIKTGTCLFIVVTDLSLTANYTEGKFGSILGNFYSNDEVRELNGISFVLPAECLYAEMIKVVHLLNSILTSNPEYFNGKSICSILVVNPTFGENNSIPVLTLLENYLFLCSKTGTKNNFNDSLLISDPWIDFGFLLEMIETSDTVLESDKKFFKKFIKQYNLSLYSKYNKINLLIRLRKEMEKFYPKYLAKDFIRTLSYNFKDPIDNLFITICELITYYQNIPIDPAGNFDKYGLHKRSIMELLGIPFTNNLALGDRGLGNGLYTASAENSPSPTLRALAEYYQTAFGHIRENFLKLHTVISKITIPYISRFSSKANLLLSGIKTNMWELLLVKNSNGEIADSLTLINPYLSNNLDKDTLEFLKAILWEINKYRFKNSIGDYTDLNYIDNKTEIEALINSDENIIKLILSGRYFELPLKRARYFERWKKVGRVGLKNVLIKELETLRDDWDLTKTSSSLRSLITKELRQNSTTMYNLYDLSPEDREYIIKNDGIYNFELDLDLLALDVSFLSIREDYFENVLLTTAACATLLHVNLAITGINRRPEIEALDVRLKSALKNEGDIEPEMEEASSGISALRKLTSVLVLAFRPLLLIKELTFGLFTNYARVFGTKGSSDKLSIKSVFEANKTIWGQSVTKWADIFTKDANIASYTLCEWLNKTYGIANEDISRTVETSMNSRFGVLANTSKWMYIANSAPDYVNRLTLFIAKMMEDGCFEAHSLDKDGNLIYDFKKDKRFSELVKYGLNSNYRGGEYLKLKGLYLAMVDLFLLEGRNFIEYDQNGNIVYKEFDRAYTTKQRDSIKEVADLAYGYYDHETKSLVDIGFFGLIYKQFLTFLTAKFNLWLKGRPSTKGDNTALGHFEEVIVNGERCYRKPIISEDNKIIDVKIVPESLLTEEEKANLDLAYKWLGDYVEGLAYSIMMTLHDLFRLDFNSIRNNKYRRANIALALHDILLGMILFYIFRWLFSGGTNKMQDIKPFLRTILRAMLDLSPGAMASLDWEPGFYSTIVNLRNDALSLFSSDDPDILKMLTRRIGAIKDWTYNMPE